MASDPNFAQKTHDFGQLMDLEQQALVSKPTIPPASFQFMGMDVVVDERVREWFGQDVVILPASLVESLFASPAGQSPNPFETSITNPRRNL